MRLLLIAALALATPVEAARRHYLAPTAQGDGSGRNAANARAFDGHDLNTRLLNDASDPEVELRLAPGLYPVRTAINVGGGTLGPRLRIRIIGEGTRPEDTVLLNERPFVNNTQDRIARFQDIDRIEVENLTFDGNWDRRLAQAGHPAMAGYYKNQPFYAAARTGRIRKVIVRNHGSVGIVPQTPFDNAAGVESFPLSVATIDVGQGPEGDDPRPWVVEDCEVHGYHSEFSGYTTLLMAGASTIPGRTPPWVGTDSARRLFLVRRCLIRGTPNGVGVIALGSAGCGAGEADGGRVTFTDNLVVNASLGFNTDCGRITNLDFTNSLFLDIWSIGNANAAYTGGMGHYNISGNSVRFDHRRDYGVYRRITLVNRRAVTGPDTILGTRQTNELIGFQLGSLSNTRYTDNQFTTRQPLATGVESLPASFQVLRKLTPADAPWVPAFADATDLDTRGNRVSSFAWDFAGLETVPGDRFPRFTVQSSEPLTRTRPGLNQVRGFRATGRVDRVLPVWGRRTQRYAWTEATANQGQRSRSLQQDEPALTGGIEVCFGEPRKESADEIRVPVRLAFQPLPGQGETRPFARSNLWLEVTGAITTRLVARTDANGIAEFRIPLRERQQGRVSLRAFHDPQAAGIADTRFSEYRVAFATLEHRIGTLVEISATPDVADEKAGHPGRLRIRRTPDAAGDLPAMEVFFRLAAEGRQARIGEDFELHPVGNAQLDTTVSRQNGLRRVQFPKDVDAIEIEVIPYHDDDLEQEWITARIHPLPQRGYDAGPESEATLFFYDGPEWTRQDLPHPKGWTARPTTLSPAFRQGTNIVVLIGGILTDGKRTQPIWWQWNLRKEAPELLPEIPASWTNFRPTALSAVDEKGWPRVAGESGDPEDPLAVLSGAPLSGVASISALSPDASVWVGWSRRGRERIPVLGSATAPQAFPTLPGWRDVQPLAVNNAGSVVGSFVANGTRRAFRLNRGQAPGNDALLPLLPGTTEAEATAVSADGSAVGWCRGTSGRRACLWPAPRPNSPATATEIGRPSGLATALALGFAGDGDILAVAGTGDRREVPYVFSPMTGSLRPLHDPAFVWRATTQDGPVDAIAINPQGWIIGTRETPSGPTPWIARRLLRR